MERLLVPYNIVRDKNMTALLLISLSEVEVALLTLPTKLAVPDSTNGSKVFQYYKLNLLKISAFGIQIQNIYVGGDRCARCADGKGISLSCRSLLPSLYLLSVR